ncbi:MAG: response regulator [Candidatus Omnitrophica bacterium]|nr:response regulator [Candidatus Omnitrophota bacterium]
MSGKRILIIEDSILICTIVASHLRNEGFLVSVARDGREGLLRARQEKPDLIILDLVLPVIPGEEVCRQLKKSADTENIPVVMLTAKSSDTDRIIGRVIGADAYIPKPFEMKKLLETVMNFLQI